MSGALTPRGDACLSCPALETDRKPTMSIYKRHSVRSSLIASALVLFASHSAAAQTAPGTPNGAALCVTCHGMHGEGAPTGAPRLAGQNAEYMSHALSMFKAKTRASPIMQPIAQTLSDAQMTELANYFAKQSAPLVDTHSAASPQLLHAGKELAQGGAPNAAACF